MRTTIFILALLINIISCNSIERKNASALQDISQNETTKPESNDSGPKEETDIFEVIKADIIAANKPWDADDTTGISNASLKQTMLRLLPEACRYAASDSTEIFYNNLMQKRFPTTYAYYTNSQADSTQKNILSIQFDNDESKDMLAIGKFIDEKQTFAIAYNVSSFHVYFYRLDNKQWKEIGHRKSTMGIPFGKIYFEELNGKPGLEIVMSTWPSNMNGNSWMECFVYSPSEDKVKYAGDFCTIYTINPKDTILTEEYGGSWYMDEHKTLYIWHNDLLVPLRKSIYIVSQNWEHPEKDPPYLEYYENPLLQYPSKNNKGLKRIFKEKYDETNPKHQKYWDDFFELGKQNIK